jgi:hypothetical protein
MRRRERILDVFDELADSIGRFRQRTHAPGCDEWFAKACDRLVREIVAYGGMLDQGDLSADQIRRLGETAQETLPQAFRAFGSTLASRLFDERAQ